MPARRERYGMRAITHFGLRADSHELRALEHAALIAPLLRTHHVGQAEPIRLTQLVVAVADAVGRRLDHGGDSRQVGRQVGREGRDSRVVVRIVLQLGRRCEARHGVCVAGRVGPNWKTGLLRRVATETKYHRTAVLRNFVPISGVLRFRPALSQG